MRQQYDENLLLDYLEGQLDDKQRAEVERWIQADPALAELMRDMAADRSVMRELPEPAPPRWVLDEVDQELERSMLLDQPAVTAAGDVGGRYHIGRWVGYGALAASLLLTGIIVSDLFFEFLPDAPDTIVVDNTSTEPREDAQPQSPPIAAEDEQREADRVAPSEPSDHAVPIEDTTAMRDRAEAFHKAAPTAAAEPARDRLAEAESSQSAGPATERLRQQRGTTDQPTAMFRDGSGFGEAVADSEPSIHGKAGPGADTVVADQAAQAAQAPQVAMTEAPPVTEQQFVLHVRTNDVERTLQQLNEMPRQIANASVRYDGAVAPEEALAPQEPGRQVAANASGSAGGSLAQAVEPQELEPSTDADAAAAGQAVTRGAERTQPPDADAATPTASVAAAMKADDEAATAQTQTVRLELEVPVNELSTVLAIMNGASNRNWQRAELNAITFDNGLVMEDAQVGGAVQADGRGAAGGLAGQRRSAIWPSLAPNYSAILEQQLPTAGFDNFRVPVIIEADATLTPQREAEMMQMELRPTAPVEAEPPVGSPPPPAD